MALAILALEGVEGDAAHFQVELGENAFYRFAIGSDETERTAGLTSLADPVFESGLVGPLPPSARGRALFTVPLDRFDREHRNIQLMSFRTSNGHGPAVSDIVTLPPYRGARRTSAEPARAASRPGATSRSGVTSQSRAASRAQGGMRRFHLVEASSKGAYSTGMFWGALVSMLPTLLSAAGPLIGKLFGGGSKEAPAQPAPAGGTAAPAAPAAPGIADTIAAFLSKPENAKLITQLVGGLVGNGAAAAAPAETPAAPAAPAASTNGTTNGAAKSTAESVRFRRRFSSASDVRLARQMDGGLISGPMIAMLIAQLAPLLEKFVSKETMNELLTSGTPQNLNQIGMDWAKFAADPFAAKAERLWANTPQVGPSTLPGLFATMDSESAGDVPAYRELKTVTLTLNGLAPVMLNGSPRVLYAAGHDVRLALSVDTPREITDATLYWTVKHRDRGESYAHGSQDLPHIAAGNLDPVVLSAADLASVPVNEPCTLCQYLVWKTKKGDYVGTTRLQFVWFVGQYAYDRVDDAGGEPVPLNDVTAHRDFWHKIWEYAFTDARRTAAVEARYYYALESGDANVPLSTQAKRGSGEPRRIRSGMVLSLQALAALRASLGAESSLGAAQLAALDTADFRNRVSQAGLATVTLRGRPGERAALWAYPEMKMQRVVLQQVGDVGEDGQVATFTETGVDFPLPVLIHLVGARTIA